MERIKILHEIKRFELPDGYKASYNLDTAYLVVQVPNAGNIHGFQLARRKLSDEMIDWIVWRYVNHVKRLERTGKQATKFV